MRLTLLAALILLMPACTGSSPAGSNGPEGEGTSNLPMLEGSLAEIVAEFSFIEEGSNQFEPPSAGEQSLFRQGLEALLRGDLASARESIEAVELEIFDFQETGGGSYFLIREPEGAVRRGSGLAVFNPGGSRPLIMEAPHPAADLDTEDQAASLFLELGARALLIAGANRCANAASSPCSGTTTVCSAAATEEPFRISDASHSVDQLFQIAHEVLIDSDEDLVAIGLHGFSQGSDDPHAFVSNGTEEAASDDAPANQLAARLKEITGLASAAQSCNDGGAGRLCGTTDVQGRYANASGNACLEGAGSATGRFLHIEQSLDLRTDGGVISPGDLAQALGEIF